MTKLPSKIDEIRVGVRELRNDLTGYLRDVRQGASVLVTSHDVVVAEIHPPSQQVRTARQPGALRGKITIKDDFDTLPAEVLGAMEESSYFSIRVLCCGGCQMIGDSGSQPGR